LVKPASLGEMLRQIETGRPRTLDGEAGSQEQVRLWVGDTSRAVKGHGRRGREGVPTARKEKPEEGKAQEGSGLGVG